jgi:hypothetical protein
MVAKPFDKSAKNDRGDSIMGYKDLLLQLISDTERESGSMINSYTINSIHP